MYRYLFSLVLILITCSLWAQPANDDCANADIINVPTGTDLLISTDLTAATQSAATNSCEVGATFFDVWYSFTAVIDGNLAIDPTLAETKFAIYDGCSGNELFCKSFIDDSRFIYTGIATGNTYLIRTWKTSQSGTDEFSIRAFATIANDECANAEAITVSDATANSYSSEIAGATLSVNPNACSASSTILDAWYSFSSPVNGNIKIDVADALTQFAVYDGCSGTELLCKNANDGDPVYLFNTTVGTSYLLRTWRDQVDVGTDAFEVQAFAAIINDECANAEAITLTAGTPTVASTDLNGATESSDVNICQLGGGLVDAWYEFTAPANGNLEISLTSDQSGYAIYDNCGGNEIYCKDISTNTTNVITGINQGSTYIIRTWRLATNNGSDEFTATVHPPVGNDECSSSTSLTLSVGPPISVSTELGGATPSANPNACEPSGVLLDVWYRFTAPLDGNVKIDVDNGLTKLALYDGCSGSQVLCKSSTSADPVFLYNATASTTYYLRTWREQNDVGTDAFELSFFTTLANDECSGAQNISVGMGSANTVASDLNGATESADPNVCDAVGPNLDAWYSFVSPVNGNIEIDVTDGQTKFAVYDGCSGTELYCKSSTDAASVLVPGFVDGLVYKLRTWRDAGNPGSDQFTIEGFEAITNDECVNSSQLQVADGVVSNYVIDVNNATQSSDPNACGVGTLRDVWYHFTSPVDGNIQIKANNTLTRFVLYDACGGNQLLCKGDQQITPVYYTSAVASASYVLRVWRSAGNPNVLVDFDIAAFAHPSNTLCANAAAINLVADGDCTDNEIELDMRAGVEGTVAGSCLTANPLELWYTYTSTIDGQIDVTPSSSILKTVIYDGCSGTELACLQGTGSFTATNGTTYLFQVSEDQISATSRDICFSTAVPLPLDLLSWTAQKADDHNLLEWSTAQEVNVDYFEVERSSDGRKFEKLGTVAASGFSNQAQSYSFRDEAPLTSNYYRLISVDLDGSMQEHGIIYLENRKTGFRVEPNPASEVLRFIAEDIGSGQLDIHLINTQGQLIAQIRPEGDTYLWDRTTIPAGVYLVQWMENGVVVNTEKLILK